MRKSPNSWRWTSLTLFSARCCRYDINCWGQEKDRVSAFLKKAIQVSCKMSLESQARRARVIS